MFYDMALKSNLHRSEPELSALLSQTAETFLFEKESEDCIETLQSRAAESGSDGSCSTSGERSQAPSRPFSPLPHNTIFGFHVPRAGDDHSLPFSLAEELERPHTPHSPAVQGTWIPTPGKTPFRQDYSYSFQESTFSRRLHRCCLEYTYRLFINPATDPKTVYRVFRLVKCMADTSKMQPYFEDLLHRNDKELLELPGLPFYTIGGAGTHYQRKDLQGKMGLPGNTRLPKRILGSVPFQGGMEDEDERYIQFLEMLGYGGVWLDSSDVEAYLRDRGVMIDAGTTVVTVQPRSGGPKLGVVAEISRYEGVRLGSQEPEILEQAPSKFVFCVQKFVECELQVLPSCVRRLNE